MSDDKQQIGAPAIQGAIGDSIPYEVIQNGLFLTATYADLHVNEQVAFEIHTDTQPLPLREIVIVRQTEVDKGEVTHGFNDSDVSNLVGKKIGVFVKLITRRPPLESAEGAYVVEEAPGT
ncbi:hypothetical protein [Luteibacter sp.]|jgi:hypothetical protein|uniref:hypothetical protein n=1 Tax=Luteibacter sp. TaxID=1886636 RepID=UPI002F42A6C2